MRVGTEGRQRRRAGALAESRRRTRKSGNGKRERGSTAEYTECPADGDGVDGEE